MTNNDERDTKFLGFARLLYADISSMTDELKWTLEIQHPELKDWLQTMLAQRAYDLACHVRENDYAYMELIPDLTQWPPTE